MKITTIVTFLNKGEQEIRSLALKNNYQGVVLVSNQCNQERIYSFVTPKADITVYESKTRGVSKARNAMAALVQTELVTFADDDIQFSDDYEKTVSDAFFEHPDADAIRFNAYSNNPDRPILQISKTKRLFFKDLTSYGAWAFFIKNAFLRANKITFDEKCGPGTSIVHGEDTLFLFEITKKAKRIYQNPRTLLSIDQKQSTWANTEEEKHIIADGYIFQKMFGKRARALGYLHLARLRSKGIHTSIPSAKSKKLFKEGQKIAKVTK